MNEEDHSNTLPKEYPVKNISRKLLGLWPVWGVLALMLASHCAFSYVKWMWLTLKNGPSGPITFGELVALTLVYFSPRILLVTLALSLIYAFILVFRHIQRH